MVNFRITQFEHCVRFSIVVRKAKQRDRKKPARVTRKTKQAQQAAIQLRLNFIG